MRHWREYYAVEVSNDGELWLDAGRLPQRSSRRAILDATEVLEASAYRMTRVVVRLEAEHFRASKVEFVPEKEPAAEAAEV